MTRILDKIKERAGPGGNLIVSAILTIGLIYVYIGFFFPDPHLIRGKWLIILWSVRIIFPLFIIGVLVLFYSWRAGRVKGASLVLIPVSVFVCALLAYPLVSHIYYHRGDDNIANKYHPYLQLIPHYDFSGLTEPRDSSLVVFCLGGSTTEFADSRGRGWPSYLEDRLNKASPGQKIEVFNCGTRWYTSMHTLINYECNLRPRRPDVIIVMHAINDLLHNADFCYFSIGPFRDDYRHFLGPVTRWIKRPALVRKLTDALGAMWYHKPRTIVNTDEFPGLVPFRRNLESLMDLADRDGVKVVLMTQPTLLKKNMSPKEMKRLHMLNYEAVGPHRRWGLETARRGMEKYNDATRELARDRGVPIFDLEKIVPKSTEYFKDDVHYQDEAYSLIADFVAERFLTGDFLPGPVDREQD